MTSQSRAGLDLPFPSSNFADRGPPHCTGPPSHRPGTGMTPHRYVLRARLRGNATQSVTFDVQLEAVGALIEVTRIPNGAIRIAARDTLKRTCRAHLPNP